MNLRLVFGFAMVGLVGGCGTARVTDTPRTATEQLLISAAVDQAVAQLDFTFLEDRKVFIDTSLVDRIDKSFLVGSVRARARREGVIVIDSVDDAQYVLELQSGAVGVNRSDYLLGIPVTEVPIPTLAVTLPEVALYKTITQNGVCRVSFTVFRRDDGRFFYASGPAYGFADHRNMWIAGVGPGTRENIQPPRRPENTAAVDDQPVSPAEATTQPE